MRSVNYFNRISSSFNINDSATVNFVYGNTAEEIYMNSAIESNHIKLINLRQLIWEYACSLGKDSVFYDDTFHGYCFDNISFFNFLHLQNENFRVEPSLNHEKHPIYKNRTISKVINLPGEEIRKRENFFNLTLDPGNGNNRIISSITEFIQMINRRLLLKDFKNTFIIFDRFDDVINKLNPDQKQQLNNLFLEFSYKPNNGIKFFLILSKHKLDPENSIFKEIPSLHYFLNLDASISPGCSKSDTTIYINTPCKNELSRFLNYFSQTNGLIFKEKQQEKILNFMLSMNQNLKFWHHVFNNLLLPTKGDQANEWFSISTLKNCLRDLARTSENRFGSIKDDDRSALERLKQDFQGIEPIVERIEEMVKMGKLGKSNPSITDGFRLHLAFLGNPGTGKTTIARLIGEVFQEEGLLSKGHFIEAKSNDFVAGYVGQTAIKTAEKCKDALGGILFIDEAYAISQNKNNGNSFGEEAIATLLKYMEDYRNDLCVIMAGYTNEMRNFIKINPGLTSRIPEANRMDFTDYNAKNLHSIFETILDKRNINITPEALQFAYFIFKDKLSKRLNSSDPRMWGNARVAEELYQELISNFYASGAIEEAATIDFSHFNEVKYAVLKKRFIHDSKNSEKETLYLNAFDEILALDQTEISNAILEFISFLELCKKRNDDDADFRPHLVFSGNPGTGKTTVARLIGRMLKEREILPSGNFIECKREDLIAHGVCIAKEKFEEALGGVLFIDEAYSLSENNDSVGREIVNALLTFMENNRKEVVVILAGYTDDMRRFLESNPGLKRRVGREILLADFTPDKLLKIFQGKLNEYNDPKILLSEDLQNSIKAVFSSMYRFRDNNFGNAGEVEKLKNAMYSNWARRLREKDPELNIQTIEENNTWEISDLPDAYKKWIQPLEPQSIEIETILAKFETIPGAEQLLSYVHYLVKQTRINQYLSKSGNLKISPIRLALSGNNTQTLEFTLNNLASLFISLGKIRNVPLDQVLVKISPSALTAGYVGQTLPKVNEIFKSAVGKVLVLTNPIEFLNNSGNSFLAEAMDAFYSNIIIYADRIAIVLIDTEENIKMFLNRASSFQAIFQKQLVINAESKNELPYLVQSKLEESYKIESNKLPEFFIQYLQGQIDLGKDLNILTNEVIMHIETNLTNRLIEKLDQKEVLNESMLTTLVESDFVL